MALKIIKNPTTGKMETVEDNFHPPTPEQLAKQRKELRDMLDGNVQFHDDPNTPKKPEPLKEEPPPYNENFDAWYYNYLP